jgi:hypothetical protein
MDERRPLHQTAACQFPLYPLATEVVRRCNLSRRVISAVLAINRVLPLFPEEATFSWAIGISQTAQTRPPKSSALESKGDGVDQRRVGYFLREWSSEIDGLIAAARQAGYVIDLQEDHEIEAKALPHNTVDHKPAPIE